MKEVEITINKQVVKAKKDKSILNAARLNNIYIPSLCTHPDLPPMFRYKTDKTVYQGDKKYENKQSGDEDEGCRLCLVDVDGEIVRACVTPVKEGIMVKTDTDEVRNLRKMNLSKILENHPHACLTCAQREGCTREPCSTNVPVEERCCPKLGNCELQKVSEFIGIPEETPRYLPKNEPKVENEPLFIRDYNLCIGCARCVRACNVVRGVFALGLVYSDGKAVAGTIALTLKESECKFCGACVEVCPTGALMDKLTAAQFDRANNYAPCTAACPVNIDIPRYIRFIAENKPEEALAVIREKVPFPRVLGRICMHPCESNCRRAELNEPLAICALKRYASEKDKGLWKNALINKKPEPTDKKVAVIGSGPAGLTAAFYTSKAGHTVTVFESASTAGGMLTHTIPLYRLPKEEFDKDLQDIMDAGDIEIRTNNALGREFSIPELQSSGYNAIFISIGLQASRMIELEGADAENVMWGIDILKEVRAGERFETGKNIIVVGGGNVAVDVARTVRKLGAEKVQMVCLETRAEMPAHNWEITAAEEEGIEVLCSWGPMKIITEDDLITGVEFKRCTCVFDTEGKFCPEYDESETTKIDADTVILAVGQTADITKVDDSTMELLSETNMLKVNNDLKTKMDGVWAGGDIVRMPGTVIDAIQMGRKAASQINKYLEGSHDISEELIKYDEPQQKIGRDEGFYDQTRSKAKDIGLENRIKSFEEVELTYDEALAVSEAKRCMQCDLRLKFLSNPMPPEPYIAFNEENINTVPEKEGVVQLMDGNKEILLIKGAMNMRKELSSRQKSTDEAKFFIFEEDPMYTQRESELLSQYMQKHGKMPGSDEDDDDLF